MSQDSLALRRDLAARARAYAGRSGIASYDSLSKVVHDRVVLFPEPPEGGAHGNFHPASYLAITSNPRWKRRLEKPHTRRGKSLPAPFDVLAREMDSCMSSDALLMNIMTYPGVVGGDVAEMLGVAPGTVPSFGVPGAVTLLHEGVAREDTTELDMQIGDTVCEAKLTETSFTSRPFAHVERYGDLAAVFDVAALPRAGKEYLSYQLIRNVLAIAGVPARQLRILIDARRPDLRQEWEALRPTIRSDAVRDRCRIIFWQDVATAAPSPLREFLAEKYGL
jgi:hypothetical protein